MEWTKTATRLGALLLGLALTLALDRALGWAGLPDKLPSFPVGPPHYEFRFDRLEYSYTLRTNDRGIRYPEIPLAKPEDVRRIVLIGDSFTEGACVPDELRWSTLIEQRPELEGRVQLVNCGEAGTHPPDYLRVLLEVGLDYEPDLVLVGIFFDDLAQTPANFDPRSAASERGPAWSRAARKLWPHVSTLVEGLSPAPEPARRRGGEVRDLIACARAAAAERGISDEAFERWRAAVPPELIVAAEERRISPGMITHALSRPDFFYDGIGVESESARARAAAVGRILDFMLETCRKQDIGFGIVLMPSVHQYDPGSSQRVMASIFAAVGSPVREEWSSTETGMQRELAAWCERRGVPILDLVPVFRAAIAQADEPLNYAIDPHWTPAGHRVTADAVAAWLEPRGWVSSR